MFGKKKCIVCDKAIEKNADYVNYKLKQLGDDLIGKFDIHADIDCFMEGSKMLRNEIENSSSHWYTEVRGRVYGINYSFKLKYVENEFNFVTYSSDRYGNKIPDKKICKFFELCKDSEHVMLAYVKAFKGTPEGSIPRVVYIKDPMIQEYLKSEGYQKIVSDAKHEYDMSVKIKYRNSADGVNALSTYIIKTCVWV